LVQDAGDGKGTPADRDVDAKRALTEGLSMLTLLQGPGIAVVAMGRCPNSRVVQIAGCAALRDAAQRGMLDPHCQDTKKALQQACQVCVNEPEVEVAAEMDEPELKLFNKWSLEDIQIDDISLVDYVAVKEGASVVVPHTAGRYAQQRFRKANCPIVERMINSFMMHGRNNGKKLMSLRIMKHTFEIIHLLTGENPVQVLVSAVVNSGPREDSTRVGRAGTVRRQAVDVSPLRRVNQAIFLLTSGARSASFRNIKTIAECLSDELINAAKGSSNSYAIKKKDELERVAKSNR